ncbi:AAA family ATPase [Salmonella enterica subsp. enterica serovar Stanley]|nr:ATPase [Salmonella enterica]EBE0997718.1 ATPase [Salmonella enterica]ECQ1030393.1 AAA family ATPase [Salmonella enterica subsp. enterica serovar Virchow]EFT4510163.1 AAA family ATPase [Salmonella enterica subsp. enterica serovar Stanley]
MQDLIAQVNKIRERNNYSQNDLASKIGRSPAVINQFLQGKYKGNEEDVAARIREFVETEEARFNARFKAPSFVETESTKEAAKLIDFARKYRTICVLTADSGLGKSTILREYRAGRTDTILIEVTSGFTPRALMKALLTELKPDASKSKSTAELMKECISGLEKTQRLILVDEAELLPYQTLEALRRLYDMAETGVVLAGLPRLTDNLVGADGEHVQLYSRIAQYLDLNGEFKRQCFDAIAVRMMPEAENDDVRNLLYYCAGNNVRRLLNIVRGVYDMCDEINIPAGIGAVREYTDKLMNSSKRKNKLSAH